MAQPPVIPIRTSSKRTFAELQVDQPELHTKASFCSTKLSESKKRLKPQSSFDSAFWNQTANIIDLELERAGYLREIRRYECLSRGGNDMNWDESQEKSDFDALETGLQVRVKRCRAQALQLLGTEDESAEEVATRQTWTTFFLTSKLGSNLELGGRRDSTKQSNFRASVIEAYGLAGTGQQDESIWDVVTGTWLEHENMTCSHLVSSRAREEAMVALFGEDAKDEMFSPRNGLMVSTRFEHKFEAGFFSIVPDLPEKSTPEMRKAWRESKVKEYKIRFLDTHQTNPLSKKAIASGSTQRYDKFFDTRNKKPWRDLDGKKLQFLNDYRPRARYVYFMHCLNVLRFVWSHKERAEALLRPELGQTFWGSGGRYVKKSMLRGLGEQIGHDFEGLLEEMDEEPASEAEAEGADETESDPTLAEAVINQIVSGAASRVLPQEDESDEDEDEDED